MKNPFANLFKKKTDGETPSVTPQPSGKKENFFQKLIKNRLGKSSVKGEQIVGVDLTTNEIRLAQIESNKANKWVLEKFFIHPVEGLDKNATVLDNQDKFGEELKIALQKSKRLSKHSSNSVCSSGCLHVKKC